MILLNLAASPQKLPTSIIDTDAHKNSECAIYDLSNSVAQPSFLENESRDKTTFYLF
jgi:hypothetical protein